MGACKICGVEGKFLFRSAIGKTAQDMFLCDKCYVKHYGPSEPVGIIGDEIVFKSNDDSAFDKEELEKFVTIKCKNCGTSLEDISNTGKFGCEICYDTYSDIIAVADTQIDNDMNKKSESPKEQKTEQKEVLECSETVEDGKLQVLEGRMQQAIKMEKYEEAAELRDRINKMKDQQE